MNHLGAWIYLTSKYEERRPWGRAALCSIALFTADWMPNQQVIVGVHSRFVGMLFGSGTRFKHCCQSCGSQLSLSAPDLFKLWERKSPIVFVKCSLPIIKLPFEYIYIHLKEMTWHFMLFIFPFCCFLQWQDVDWFLLDHSQLLKWYKNFFHFCA